MGNLRYLLYWQTRIIMVTFRGSMHDDPILYIVKRSDKPDVFHSSSYFNCFWSYLVTERPSLEKL